MAVKNEYEDVPMPLGKFKGKLICNIPNSYLEWIVGEKWFKQKYSRLCIIAEMEIAYRKRYDVIIKD